MYNDEVKILLNRLNLEDYIFLLYGSIILFNIYGNYYEKEYVKTNDINTYKKYNSIFEIIFILTFFIYIYLLVRNYNNYKKANDEEKEVYLIRVFGAVFLIVGVLCFIYYQDVQRTKYN